MDLVLVQCGVDPWLVPMVVVWALQRLRLGGKRCLLLLDYYVYCGPGGATGSETDGYDRAQPGQLENGWYNSVRASDPA